MMEFIQHHDLPKCYRETWIKHIQPLATWIAERKGDKPLVVGINGAQGSGKTTLASALEMILSNSGLNVARLSLDDLYLTKKERARLAIDIYPLLKTRGVPGTHDVSLGIQTLTQLLTAKGEVLMPRFDKTSDDRADKALWSRYKTPVDIVLFEGWCVGTPAQQLEDLSKPVNQLEEIEDKDGVWRRYANQQLATTYQPLFTMIDALVFLQAPNFEAILAWRMKQELQTFSGSVIQGMDKQGIQRFNQHFERLTRVALAELPSKAEKVLKLDDRQLIVDSYDLRAEGLVNR